MVIWANMCNIDTCRSLLSFMQKAFSWRCKHQACENTHIFTDFVFDYNSASFDDFAKRWQQETCQLKNLSSDSVRMGSPTYWLVFPCWVNANKRRIDWGNITSLPSWYKMQRGYESNISFSQERLFKLLSASASKLFYFGVAVLQTISQNRERSLKNKPKQK